MTRVLGCLMLLFVPYFAALAEEPAAPAPEKPGKKKVPANPGKAEAETKEASLKIGDPAPPLTVGKWVKGEPVKEFEKGTVYVVEFWATWCGPCRESIPHLTALQAKFKDQGVIFIGQNVSDESEKDVVDFVAQMGDKMNYRVATDQVAGKQEGKMSFAWLTAAGQDGIPTAFIVDKEQKIAWLGSPHDLGKVIPDIVAGTFDSAKFARELKEREAVEAQVAVIDSAVQMKKWDKALKLADQLVADHPSAAGRAALVGYQVHLGKADAEGVKAAGEKLTEAMKDDADLLFDAVVETINSESKVADLSLAERWALRLKELNPEDDDSVRLLGAVYAAEKKYEPALETLGQLEARATSDDTKMAVGFQIVGINLEKKDSAAAKAACTRLLASAKDDFDTLTQMANAIIAEEKKPSPERLEIVVQMLTHANELAKGKNSELLVSLAKAHFQQGDVGKAVDVQTKAVEAAKGGKKKKLQKQLDEYKKDLPASTEKSEKSEPAEKPGDKDPSGASEKSDKPE